MANDTCLDCTASVFLGAFWNGRDCFELFGCGCAGDGCSGRFASVYECEAVQARCNGARCVDSGGEWFPALHETADGSDAVIRGNYIGVNAAGTTAVANTIDGIYIKNNPLRTIIGGSATDQIIVSDLDVPPGSYATVTFSFERDGSATSRVAVVPAALTSVMPGSYATRPPRKGRGRSRAPGARPECVDDA